jgi:hypothetical protein
MSKGIQVLLQFIGTAIIIALLVMGTPYLERYFNQVHLLMWGTIFIAIGLYAIRKKKTWKWRIAPFLLSMLFFISFASYNFGEAHNVTKYNNVEVGFEFSVEQASKDLIQMIPGKSNAVSITVSNGEICKSLPDSKFKMVKPGSVKIMLSSANKKYTHEFSVSTQE